MPGLTEDHRKAMASALNRAAQRLDDRAKDLDDRVAHWRKGRPGDDTPIVAHTLHQVASQLRQWATQCLKP
jgi:hypothetical protein